MYGHQIDLQYLWFIRLSVQLETSNQNILTYQKIFFQEQPSFVHYFDIICNGMAPHCASCSWRRFARARARWHVAREHSQRPPVGRPASVRLTRRLLRRVGQLRCGADVAPHAGACVSTRVAAVAQGRWIGADATPYHQAPPASQQTVGLRLASECSTPASAPRVAHTWRSVA